MRVNFHYYLDDNCGGSVYPWRNQNLYYNQVYQYTEDLINETNARLGNNQTQRGYEDFYGFVRADAHYNPLRLLLSGVYVHCDSDGHAPLNNHAAVEDQYLVNENQEINIFCRNILFGGGSASISGTSNQFRLDNINVGVLLHELGHLLTLNHSWDDATYCNDLPDMRHPLDYFCDGGQTFINCADFDYPPCEDICDEWGHISNNIMSYAGNGHKKAFTPCQLTGYAPGEGIMTNLIDERCDQIEQIGPFGGSCKPPRAFVGHYPYTDPPQVLQLHMEASINDYEHRAQFYKQTSSGEALFYDTQWLNGEAPVYTIALSGMFIHDFIDFEVGTYRVQLSVKNDCNAVHTFSEFFTLDRPRMVSSGITEYSYDQLALTYSTDRDDEIEIFSINTFTGEYNEHLQQKVNKCEGEYIIDKCVENWHQGLNSIIVHFKDTTHIHQIYIE